MVAKTNSEYDLSLALPAFEKKHKADVVLLKGGIYSPLLVGALEGIGKYRKNKKLFLMVHTPGGDASEAFRVARCFQQNYQSITVMIAGECKSAGTLLAIGADSLILWDCAELGPLDVQVRKKDEIWERVSGLNAQRAIDSLVTKAHDAFRQNMLDLRVGSRLHITTRTAAELATNLTAGLFAPIFSQIDPDRVAEDDRAMEIAKEYGRRLDKGNLITEVEREGIVKTALAILIADYPSHDFVAVS